MPTIEVPRTQWMTFLDTISAGPGPGESISHVIADPLRVRLLRTFAGDDDVLEIQAADESRTLVYFER